MTRYLMDSGIASDYVNRRRSVYERGREAAAHGDQIGIGLPVLAELWAGVEWSESRDFNEKRLRHHLGQLYLWPFDKNAAEEYGRIHVVLRRAGRLMQQNDVQIAAIARCLGNCTVVTKDSDFLAIPDLSIVDWSRP